MLSKSLGHILRVSTALHVLFHTEIDKDLSDTISQSAVDAAIDFVEVCCQHTAYIFLDARFLKQVHNVYFINITIIFYNN